jgi:uncharacterized protein (TIGR02145 family)
MNLANKKGKLLSILGILLITFLVLGVLGVVSGSSVKKSDLIQVSSGKLITKTLNLEIKNSQITCTEDIKIKIELRKENFVGLKFIIKDGINSEVFTEYVSMNELETKVFGFTLSQINPEDVTKIKIYPLFKSNRGKLILGNENIWIRDFSSDTYQCIYNCDLEVPAALDATDITDNGFVANWNTLPDAEGYYLDVASDSSFDNLIINNLDVGDVSGYEVSELSLGTLYYYRVRAYEGSCISDSSNVILTSLPIRYGLLYNWYAVSDSRNIANTGWHVPTTPDFVTLLNNWNYNDRHVVLTEAGTTYWYTSFGNNSAGFNARGNGRRHNLGFGNLKSMAFFGTAWGSEGGIWQVFNIYNVGSGVDLSSYYSYEGTGIRLVKDSTTLTNGQTGTYTGNDGRVYRTIAIGTPAQEWLADNLAETEYRNGDAIAEVTDNTEWTGLTTGALCAYNNDWSYV